MNFFSHLEASKNGPLCGVEAPHLVHLELDSRGLKLKWMEMVYPSPEELTQSAEDFVLYLICLVPDGIFHCPYNFLVKWSHAWHLPNADPLTYLVISDNAGIDFDINWENWHWYLANKRSPLCL